MPTYFAKGVGVPQIRRAGISEGLLGERRVQFQERVYGLAKKEK